jgi:hypothetical protein
MKKIMIAAAVAAIGYGAFGATSCSPCGQTTSSCAPALQSWVYKWQFKGKTTTGKAVKYSSNPCSGKQSGPCPVRVPASLKIQGYTYTCSTEPCAKDSVGNLAFESAFNEVNEVFWQTKPFKASFWGGVTMEFAHLIGKKKNKAEVLGTAIFTDNLKGATYGLTFAGFGKVKDKVIKKVSGNFAGYLSQPYAKAKKTKYSGCSACGTTDCDPAGYWGCVTLVIQCKGPSIAYGKWSAKYVKSASAKYFKNGSGIKMPKWAVQLNGTSANGTVATP